MISKDFGPLTISQDAGVATISIDDSIALGGGSVKGFVSASGKASVQVHELVLADAGLDELAVKEPALAGPIGVLKTYLDAEIAKL